MACRLVGAMPLSEPMLELDPLDQTSIKFTLKFIYFHSRKCIWKCRLGNGGNLSRLQCVNCPICAGSLKKCNNFVPYKLPFIRLPSCWFVSTLWHHPSCLLGTKRTPMCAPLWRHICYCYNIMISCIEQNTAILLAEKFKLYLNFNEWIPHVQFKYFATPPKSVCTPACMVMFWNRSIYKECAALIR